MVLGKSYDWPSTSEATLTNMSIIVWYLTTTHGKRVNIVFIILQVFYKDWKYIYVYYGFGKEYMAVKIMLSIAHVFYCTTVKPVCNDHLYNNIYNLWFIQ